MNAPYCVVLARGGSKRIPHKNIRRFNGLPMVAWPVQSAVSADIFAEVFISTDSQEIEKTAQKYGAASLSLRAAHLSGDFVSTAEVLAAFLSELEISRGVLPRYLCCLYGTSVFATREWLRWGWQIIQQEEYDCVMAVTPYSHPIERALRFDDSSGMMEYLTPDAASQRTQDCQTAYYDIGLFYWIRVETFIKLSHAGFSQLTKTALITPRAVAIDIDTPEDWELAEYLHKYQYTS